MRLEKDMNMIVVVIPLAYRYPVAFTNTFKSTSRIIGDLTGEHFSTIFDAKYEMVVQGEY